MPQITQWDAVLKKQLELFLNDPDRPRTTMNFLQLDGFVRAITLSPEFNPSINNTTEIFGREDPNYKDINEINQFYHTFFSLKNAHLHEFFSQKCSLPCSYQYHPEKEKRADIENWCAGFIIGFNASKDSWCDYLELYPDAEIEPSLNLQAPLAKQLASIIYIVKTVADSEKAIKEGSDPNQLADIFNSLEECIIYCGLISKALILADKNALRSKFSELADKKSFSEEPQRQPLVRATKKMGRNDPCPCGSGKKFKKCCLH